MGVKLTSKAKRGNQHFQFEQWKEVNKIKSRHRLVSHKPKSIVNNTWFELSGLCVRAMCVRACIQTTNSRSNRTALFKYSSYGVHNHAVPYAFDCVFVCFLILNTAGNNAHCIARFMCCVRTQRPIHPYNVRLRCYLTSFVTARSVLFSLRSHLFLFSLYFACFCSLDGESKKPVLRIDSSWRKEETERESIFNGCIGYS